MLTPKTPPSFSELDKFLQKLVDDNKTPGSIFLLYKQGEIVFLQKYGWQDIENSVLIEFDTIFRIYSMTKPIITIGLMMLYEEGKFELEDPISNFISEFKGMKVFVEEEENKIITEELERNITILDLLTHTSGLSYGFFEDDPIDKIYKERLVDKLKSLTLEEAMKILADIPLRFQPGKYFRYSYSIDVLGRLIEVLSGQSLDVYLREKIFQPLEMENTSFFVSEDKFSKLAKPYLYSSGNHLNLIETPNVIERFSKDYRFFSGGGGLVSTLNDYFNFTLMFLNDGQYKDNILLKPETISLITKNHLKGNRTITDFAFSKQLAESMKFHAYGHGLGIRVLIGEGLTLAGKGEHGWGGAAFTYYWIDPQNEVIGLFMTQVFSPDPSTEVVSGAELMNAAYKVFK